MKTSIVILSFNKKDYTRQCIESIRKYTDKDSYEIIVVDNNSTDGTIQWLIDQPGITKICNHDNLGFPKGCNQGILASKGENILLLNNDTIVTHNWLNNLLKCLYSSEDIGCVGPLTNYSSYYQSIKVTYNTIPEMHEFAKQFNSADPAKWEDRLKLVGFCLLFKREVMEKIGLMDEIFSPGNFEDDDYCLRIRKAGYRVVLCNDTFIHHFGSISFGEDPNKFNSVLVANKDKFEGKWGISADRLTELRYDIVNLVEAPSGAVLKILQVDCGGGGTLLALRHKHPHAELYATENSKNLLAEADKKSHIEIIDKCCMPICFQEIPFDYIIFTDSTMTIADLIEYIKEFAKRHKGKCSYIFSIKSSGFELKSFADALSSIISFSTMNYYDYIDQTVVIIKDAYTSDGSNKGTPQDKLCASVSGSLPAELPRPPVNEMKICFICCVNDKSMFKKCYEYINSLIFPAEFTIEIILIEDAEGIVSVYNSAVNHCDAKYKIYLHQDLFIVNKNFINEILSLFSKHPELGMIGVAGAKAMPFSGIWWEALHRYGKVYDSHTGIMQLLEFEDVSSDYESVQCIDGLIMITQYDLPWREDLFTGWHFYDASQSMEFIKAGYSVGIPKQNEAWCIHDCGIVNVSDRYDEFKKIYLKEYASILFPKVSILIPTHNRPQYLKKSLESALAQTYENLEIIISDNSTNDESEEMLRYYLDKHSNILYSKDEALSEPMDNFNKCLSLSSGEYISYLMDDDLLHPEKIREMLSYLLQNKAITLVTSYRQLIDENGNELPPIEATQKISDKTIIISGSSLGNYVLANVINIIGEATTTMFRKNDLEGFKYGVYKGRQYVDVADLATWLTLLSKGTAVYIPNPLSYLRLHEGNSPFTRLPLIINGISEWLYLIQASKGTPFLTSYNEYAEALLCWLHKNLYIIDMIRNGSISKNIDLGALSGCFSSAFRNLLEPGAEGRTENV